MANSDSCFRRSSLKHRSEGIRGRPENRSPISNPLTVGLAAILIIAGMVSGEGLLDRLRQRLGNAADKKEDSDRQKVLFRFFDDAFTPGGFKYAYPEESNVVITENEAKNGEVSLQFDLVASAYSGGSVCLYNGTYDLRDARKRGAELSFWVKGAVGNESVLVALVDEAVSDDKKTVVRLRVDWYGCDSITTDWTPVSIPLKEFRDKGVYWNPVDSVEIEEPFDWGEVAEFRIEARKDENRTLRVWVDDIFIVRCR